MIKRIITGLILVACLVGILFLRGVTPYVFDGFIFLLMIASMYELYSAFLKIDVKCNLWCLGIGAILFIVGTYFIPFILSFIMAIAVTLVWFISGVTFVFWIVDKSHVCRTCADTFGAFSCNFNGYVCLLCR